MTRNPPQHERKQRRAAAGVEEGGAAAEASGAEEPRKNANASRKSSHWSTNKEAKGEEPDTRQPLKEQGRTAA